MLFLYHALLINNEKSLCIDTARVTEFTNVPNVEHTVRGVKKNTLPVTPFSYATLYIHDGPFTREAIFELQYSSRVFTRKFILSFSPSFSSYESLFIVFFNKKKKIFILFRIEALCTVAIKWQHSD